MDDESFGGGKFDVSKVDRPTVTLLDWDSDTITVSVVGNNASGTFRRARMWLNRNVDVPLEPDDGRDPVSVDELSGGTFVRKWAYRFRRLD